LEIIPNPQLATGNYISTTMILIADDQHVTIEKIRMPI